LRCREFITPLCQPGVFSEARVASYFTAAAPLVIVGVEMMARRSGRVDNPNQ
jgi:hypothetical protein